MKRITKYIISIVFVLTSSSIQAQWGHWERLETDTTTPGERWGIEMATIGDKKAILFGGETNGSIKLSDTWLFDFVEKRWTKVNCSTSPDSRYDYTLTKISERQVLLFGGEADSFNIKIGFKRNDFWVFDLDSMNWFKVFEDTSFVHLARNRHKTSIFNDSLLMIFAGVNWRGFPTSDVWLYNYKKHKVVTRIMNSDPWIKNRSIHQMDRVRNNLVYIFGGDPEGTFLSDDNLIFDEELKLKRNLDVENNCEPTAAGQMKHIRDGLLLMFGGLPENFQENTWGDRTRIFDFNNRIWKELDLEERPIGRLYYGMTLIDTNTVMIYGGLIKGAKNLAHKTETWIFHLDSVPTSVDGYNNDDEFVITPNPAGDYVEINLNNVIPAKAGIQVLSVKVFDVLGIEHPATAWHPSIEGNVRIDVSTLSPGVYFVRVGGRMYKFVKI